MGERKCVRERERERETEKETKNGGSRGKTFDREDEMQQPQKW